MAGFGSRLTELLIGGIVIYAIIIISIFYYYHQIMFHEVFTAKNTNELEQKISTAQNLCPRCSFPGLTVVAGILEKYKQGPQSELLGKAELILDQIVLKGTLNPTHLFYLAQVRMYQGRTKEANIILSKIKTYDKLRNNFNLLITPNKIEPVEEKTD